jgi:hypothetical protein
MKALVLPIVLCLVTAAAARQPPPARDARATPAGPGATIAGRVVDDRETPVPGAAVYLVGGRAPGARTAITTEEGRFAIGDLDAATYTLAVSKHGYPAVEAGQLRAGGPGAPIALQAGQRLVITVHLPRGAVITGTVTDDLGEPAPGRQVVVAPASAPAAAIRRRGGYANADRHGRFRIFGLGAGTYRVGTAAPGGPFNGLPESAVSITVAPGEERDAGELRVPPPVLATQVTVLPMASDAQPLPYVRIELRRPGEVRSAYSSGTRNPDGSTTFAGVRAGQYKAIARTDTHWGGADITVDGERPATVSLTLVAGARVRGAVSFDVAAPPIARGSYLHIVPADIEGVIADGNQSVSAPVGPDGAFVLSGVPPGRYLLRVQHTRKELEDWKLDSVRVGEIDAADVPFEVKRDDIAGIAVTLTQSRTLLKGIVVSAAGTPANGVDLVLFPSDPRFRTRGTRRVGFARTDIDGQFEIGGLPPGAYEIAAVDEPDREALQDPAALSALTSVGSVTLRRDETLTPRIVLRR